MILFEILFGIFYYICFILICGIIAVLLGDILMIKVLTKISWKESARCGWLYFIDRFKKR